ncbi:hypothetical protein BDR05DRAFT_950147 [Suillus weaverae]|nr:hypothetical protein BDR05DRAFT_950147 [Suillus weaverae]
MRATRLQQGADGYLREASYAWAVYYPCYYWLCDGYWGSWAKIRSKFKKLPGKEKVLVKLEEVNTTGIRDGPALIITVFGEHNLKAVEQAHNRISGKSGFLYLGHLHANAHRKYFALVTNSHQPSCTSQLSLEVMTAIQLIR